MGLPPRQEIGCLLIPRFPLACEAAGRGEHRAEASGRGEREAEAAGRPGLVGRPVAVSVPGSPRVVEVSAEAEAAGVLAGQTLREALARCPGLLVIEGHPSRHDIVHEAVLCALEEIVPGVEPGGPGIAFMELGSLYRIWRRPGDLHAALVHAASVALFQAANPSRRQARGATALGGTGADGLGDLGPLRPRLGVAPTKYCSLAAARRADPGGSCTVTPEEMPGFLARQPLAGLPVPAEMLRRLRLLGLVDAGEVAALPRGALDAQFGTDGIRVWDLLHGAPDPIAPRARQERIVERTCFDEPLASRPALLAAAEQALAAALGNPRRAGRALRQVVIGASTERGAHWERTVTFRDARVERSHIWPALCPVLEEAALPGPVEELSLELSGLCPSNGWQARLPLELGQDAADCAGRRREAAAARRDPQAGERLRESLRQLAARYGRCPVGRVVVMEPWSRIPERRAALGDFDL